jgi:hypothetical protein
LARKKAKNGGTKLYLIAPAAGETGPVTVTDPTVANEGVVQDAFRAIIGERKEVEVDSAIVTRQIDNYVTVIRDVSEGQAAQQGAMRLSEITLSLTLSASGNIGIASTSAEAGITLLFKRD